MQSLPVSIGRTCLLNNIDVHMSNTSITLSTTAMAQGFRCDASVPIVLLLSQQNEYQFMINKQLCYKNSWCTCNYCVSVQTNMSILFYNLSLQTYFLPVIGLVDAEKLSPGDLVVRYTFVVGGESLQILLLYNIYTHFFKKIFVMEIKFVKQQK